MCSLFRDLVCTKKSFKKYLQTHEGEIDTIFNSSCFCLLQMLQYSWNSSCLFTKNILIRACLFTFHISRYLRLLHTYLRLLHTVPSFDKHYQMSPLSSSTTKSFNRHLAISAAVRFRWNSVADSFRGCSSDIVSSNFSRRSKVTEHVTSRLSGSEFKIN